MKEFQIHKQKYLELIKSYQELIEKLNILHQKINPFLINNEIIDNELLKSSQVHYQKLITIQAELEEIKIVHFSNVDLLNTNNIEKLYKIVSSLDENTKEIEKKLNQFLLLKTNDKMVNNDLEEFKNQVVLILKELSPTTPKTKYNPYLVFLEYAKNKQVPNGDDGSIILGLSPKLLLMLLDKDKNEKAFYLIDKPTDKTETTSTLYTNNIDNETKDGITPVSDLENGKNSKDSSTTLKQLSNWKVTHSKDIEFSVKRFKSDFGDFDKKKQEFVITKNHILGIIISVAKIKIYSPGLNLDNKKNKAELDANVIRAFEKGYFAKIENPINGHLFYCLSEYGINIFNKEQIRKDILKPFILKQKSAETLPNNLFTVPKDLTLELEKSHEITNIDKIIRVVRFVMDEFMESVQDYFFDELDIDNYLYFKVRMTNKNEIYDVLFTNNPNYIKLPEDSYTKLIVFVSGEERQVNFKNNTFDFSAYIDQNTNQPIIFSIKDSISIQTTLKEIINTSSSVTPVETSEDSFSENEINKIYPNKDTNSSIEESKESDLEIQTKVFAEGGNQSDEFIEDSNTESDQNENEQISETEKLEPQKNNQNESVITYSNLTIPQKAKYLLDYKYNPVKHKDYFKQLIDDLISEMANDEIDGIKDYNQPIVNHNVQVLVLLKSLINYNFNDDKIKEEFEFTYKQILHGIDSTFDETNHNIENISQIYSNQDDKIYGYRSVFHLGALIRLLFDRESFEYDDSGKVFEYVKSIYDTFDQTFPKELNLLHPLFKKLKDFNFNTKNKHYKVFPKKHIQLINGQNNTEQELKRLRSKILADIDKFQSSNQPVANQFIKYFLEKNDSISSILKDIKNFKVSNKESIRQFISLYSNSKNNGNAKPKIENFVKESFDDWVNVREGRHSQDQKPKLHLFLNKTINIFEQLLNHFKDWINLEHESSENLSEEFLRDLKSLKESILIECKEISRKINSLTNKVHIGAIKYLVKSLTSKLNSQDNSPVLFADLLRTGYWRFDSQFKPIFGYQYPMFENWVKALLHISTHPLSFKIIETKILQIPSNLDVDYCYNFGQLEDIHRFQNDFMFGQKDIIKSDYQMDFDAYNSKYNEEFIDKILEEIEAALAKGGLKESTRDKLVDVINSYNLREINQSRNYSIFNKYLSIINFQINDETRLLSESLREILIKLEDDLASSKINKEDKIKISQTIKIANDYLDQGEINLAEDLKVQIQNNHIVSYDKLTSDFKSIYSQFTSHPLTDQIIRITKDISVKKIEFPYKKLVENGHLPEEDNEFIIENMFSTNSNLVNHKVYAGGSYTENSKFVKLLKNLGFSVLGVTEAISENKINEDNPIFYKYLKFKVNFEKTPSNKDTYSHPISPFGTSIDNKNVFIFFDKISVNELLDEVINLPINFSIPIIIVNWAYTLEDRKRLAYIFHTKSEKQKEFILIDWTLLLYLIPFGRNERLQIILGVSLPLTTKIQPFNDAGSSYLPDEMFIGRTKELDKITSLNGETIVYGGRQLGKTALLMRARSLFNEKNHKENLRFAIYIDGKGISTYDQFIQKLKDEFKPFDLLEDYTFTDIKGFKNSLEKTYKVKWNNLLLLIDEVDNILQAFKLKHSNYEDLSHLVELRKLSRNNFKFVLAGLHDLCRLVKNQNTIFSQFGSPLVITPLTPIDAVRLISLPLSYFGFSFDNQVIQKILTNTLFYPGIIHFVGKTIIDNLNSKFSDFFNEKSHPPFVLDKNQLNKLIKEVNMNGEINKKIDATLRVDAKHYLVLAYALALKYFEKEEEIIVEGFTPQEILNTIKGLIDSNYPHLVAWNNITLEETMVYLDEMKDMGILATTNPNEQISYQFKRRRFLDAIGSNYSDVFSKLTDNFKQ